HKYVGREIDDEVEYVARPARQSLRHARAPRKGAVKAVDDQGDAEPGEHFRPVGSRRRHQRKQPTASATGGKDVDRKGDRRARLYRQSGRTGLIHCFPPPAFAGHRRVWGAERTGTTSLHLPASEYKY